MMSETQKLEQHIRGLKLKSSEKQVPKSGYESPNSSALIKVSAMNEYFQSENSNIDDQIDRLENEHNLLISYNDKNNLERYRSRSLPRYAIPDLPNLDENGLPTKPMFNF